MYSTFMPLAMWKTSNCDYGIQWFIFLHSFESWFNLEWLIWWFLFLNRAVHFCGRNIWQNFQALDEIQAKNLVKNIPPKKKTCAFFPTNTAKTPMGLDWVYRSLSGSILDDHRSFFQTATHQRRPPTQQTAAPYKNPKWWKKDVFALRKRHECSPNFIGTVAKKGWSKFQFVFLYFVMFFGALCDITIHFNHSFFNSTLLLCFLVPACRKKISWFPMSPIACHRTSKVFLVSARWPTNKNKPTPDGQQKKYHKLSAKTMWMKTTTPTWIHGQKCPKTHD